MQVLYSYLDQQFNDVDGILSDIGALAKSGDFTLGSAVSEFEERFAELCGIPYAVGVGSGTDALALSLKAIGVGYGDEVITTPNTFVATLGAIVMCGAKPVFVDNGEDYTIDLNQIESAVTRKTAAILPVHLTGHPSDMPGIMEIADRCEIPVIEDAAQAILASIDGHPVGSWGVTAGFSLHPLKNLNVWGDGGVILTTSLETRDKLRLLRNHGLANRDEVIALGHNSRLDSLQAVIGNRLIGDVHWITEQRIANALKLDQGLSGLGEYINIPSRKPEIKQVYHTYVIRVSDRDALVDYLVANGIEAKVHYPIPLHLQKATSYLGHQEGDFPYCESDCKTIISLPAHQYLLEEEIEYIIDHVSKFYQKGPS